MSSGLKHTTQLYLFSRTWYSIMHDALKTSCFESFIDWQSQHLAESLLLSIIIAIIFSAFLSKKEILFLWSPLLCPVEIHVHFSKKNVYSRRYLTSVCFPKLSSNEFHGRKFVNKKNVHILYIVLFCFWLKKQYFPVYPLPFELSFYYFTNLLDRKIDNPYYEHIYQC